MPISPSRLREDIYRILDTILETGEPLEVERRGRILRIVPPERISKLDRLKKRACIKGHPEDLVHLDWSEEWKP